MGQRWVRLDAAFARNPKVIDMLADKDGFRAALVYVCALGYCGEQGTDGFVPRGALPFVHGRPRDADLLVKHRLWQAQNGTGWLIPDWAEYQPSTVDTQARSRAARKACCYRWHQQPCGCWDQAS